MIDSAALRRAVLGGGPEVGVRVEGRRRLRVAEGTLDGYDVAPGRDEPGGVEVSEVVELDAGQPGVAQRLAPPVADGVLVRWVVALPREEPPVLAGGAMGCDVLGEHVDQAVSEVDDALRAVLRRPYVDRPTVDALHLAGDLERPAEEVDVAELNSGVRRDAGRRTRRGR